MRLFVAVPIPEDIRKRISSLAKEIDKEGISLVKYENMHLTLKFMGDVDPKKLSEIKEKLGAIKFGKIECRLKGIGVFPNENYARVLWVGAESDGALEGLAKSVQQALQGYGKEEPFTAHLTIARIKRKVELEPFLKKFRSEEFGSFLINDFELIESTLSNVGPVYSIITNFESR